MLPLHLATARLAADVRPDARHLALPLVADAARWYWGHDLSRRLLGWGAACRLVAQGADRFARLAANLRLALAEGRWSAAGAEIAVADLPWFLGFGFWDDRAWPGFPAAVLVLPRLGALWRADGPALVWALDPDPAAAASAASAAVRLLERSAPAPAASDAPPSTRSAAYPADLERRIAMALREIRSGVAQKVVLAGARTARRGDGRAWDPSALLERRMRADADAFHYLLSPERDLAWLGATPERLVAVRDDRMETMALAGSRPRGEDPAADAALGAELLASVKDRAEHRLVVEAIVQGLEGMGLRPEIDGPCLRRLTGLQHLQTLLSADLGPAITPLDLLAVLHPTPALGGWPRAAALEIIGRWESLPDGRGWYGGGAGWLDGRGQGDVSVGIRGILIRGPQATAYAGAGLVEGSDPEAEAAEIAVKMTAAMGALTSA